MARLTMSLAILKWGLGHHAAYLGPKKVQGAMMVGSSLP